MHEGLLRLGSGPVPGPAGRSGTTAPSLQSAVSIRRGKEAALRNDRLSAIEQSGRFPQTQGRNSGLFCPDRFVRRRARLLGSALSIGRSQIGGPNAVTRRLVLVLALVVAMYGTVVASATADVEAQVGLEVKPLPALPIGPGPLYPLDSYGPRADDDAALRWSEQTLAAIRVLHTGPTVQRPRPGRRPHGRVRRLGGLRPGRGRDPTGRVAAPPRRRAQRRLQEPGDQPRRLPRPPEPVPRPRGRLPGPDDRHGGYDPDDASTDPASPTRVGNQAAAAVLAFRATDGSNQAGGCADTTGYVPVNTPDQVNDPFRWQPLRHPPPAAPPSSRST